MFNSQIRSVIRVLQLAIPPRAWDRTPKQVVGMPLVSCIHLGYGSSVLVNVRLLLGLRLGLRDIGPYIGQTLFLKRLGGSLLEFYFFAVALGSLARVTPLFLCRVLNSCVLFSLCGLILRWCGKLCCAKRNACSIASREGGRAINRASLVVQARKWKLGVPHPPSPHGATLVRTRCRKP